MTTEEYLIQRISDLEKNIRNKNLPMKFRINQAKALSFFRIELEKIQNQ